MVLVKELNVLMVKFLPQLVFFVSTFQHYAPPTIKPRDSALAVSTQITS
jgi:hypothetical protein